jgi:hypothetical protein
VLFPGQWVSGDNRIDEPGRWFPLPSKRKWFFLDDRPGVETILGLASYDALDLQTIERQLKSLQNAPGPPSRAITPEDVIVQEFVDLRRRGVAHDAGLVRGADRLRLRGAGGAIEDTGPARVPMPDDREVQTMLQTVRGYATAVWAVTYEHR